MDSDTRGDAERALRAHDDLLEIGPGRRGGRLLTGMENALRGDDGELAHHVVEAPVAGRVLPGRAGHGEAADRRVGERLREVAELQAVLGEQEFGVWAGQAGSERGEPGHGVDVLDRVETAKVHRDHGVEIAGHGVHAANHRGAATEGDHRDLVFGAVLEDCEDLVLCARDQYCVGRGYYVPRAPFEEVERGLPARPRHALFAVLGHVLRADDPLEILHRGFGKPRLGERHRRRIDGVVLIGIDPHRLREKLLDRIAQRLRFVRGSPQVETHRRKGD